MLRLAFDFIITWRETRTRPNAYATDGYTVENNWCPSERFDSNRPGPHNVWKKNGPQVDESIKQKAGRVAVGGVSQPRIIIKTK